MVTGPEAVPVRFPTIFESRPDFMAIGRPNRPLRNVFSSLTNVSAHRTSPFGPMVNLN